MSITPRGMSVQEAYRLYRDARLLVNRKYQRKLVWTKQEKAYLIDSILKGLPIPLFLLAKKTSTEEEVYEIIDGVQRFNAIFSFIENAFSLPDGRYFDTQEFARARQAAEAGEFVQVTDLPLLSPDECADLLDYQLAVTVFPASSENEITEVFGRINSSGRQLSPQEKRQAGIVTPFANIVREISVEIRGDVSREVLPLTDMPEISIDTHGTPQGYKLKAEEIFWCKQGVLRPSQLRSSEDEEMVADILVSILREEPFPRSREKLDVLYTPTSDLFKSVEVALLAYPPDRLRHEITMTFSVLREVIETYSEEYNALRKIINPESRNPIKTAFYAIFMAFFKLVVQEECSPNDPAGIMEALKGLQKRLIISAHYAKPEDRRQNINIVYGLIRDYFVKKPVHDLGKGHGLIIEFENLLRRSHIESSRYECKQGLLRLDEERKFDSSVLKRIVETVCAIANIGPSNDGGVFIGVADNKRDAERIQELDAIEPIEVIGSGRYVVGIEREARLLDISLEKYVTKIVEEFQKSSLSEPLKTEILSKIDMINYKGRSVVWIPVSSQQDVSFVGEEVFVREGASTRQASPKKAAEVQKLFQKKA